jgi:hypothetical protein
MARSVGALSTGSTRCGRAWFASIGRARSVDRLNERRRSSTQHLLASGCQPDDPGPTVFPARFDDQKTLLDQAVEVDAHASIAVGELGEQVFDGRTWAGPGATVKRSGFARCEE